MSKDYVDLVSSEGVPFVGCESNNDIILVNRGGKFRCHYHGKLKLIQFLLMFVPIVVYE